MKIPTRIVLPFGFIVTVKVTDPCQFKDELGRSLNQKDCYAWWLHEQRIIYLSTKRTIKQRRADLIHEMGHVLTDWQSDMQWRREVDVKS